MGRDPVTTLLQDPKLDPTLHQRLQLSQQVRTFATEVLALPDNKSYRDYVAIKRDYVVWNVVATPRFSITPVQHCFLIVGCLSYRGYYAQDDAKQFATGLAQQGYDVMVAGSQAYSTLGWFADPLLSSFVLVGQEERMIEIIFHELAHQQLYIEHDSAFNEAFATLVAQEGVRRWYQHVDNPDGWERYQVTVQRKQAFNALLLSSRDQLQQLFQQPSELGLAAQKAAVFTAMQQRYQQLKQSWSGYSGYDAWMAQPLNNAHLALSATYHQWVEGFRHLLIEGGGALPYLYQRAAELGQLPAAERAAHLKAPQQEAG